MLWTFVDVHSLISLPSECGLRQENNTFPSDRIFPTGKPTIFFDCRVRLRRCQFNGSYHREKWYVDSCFPPKELQSFSLLSILLGIHGKTFALNNLFVTFFLFVGIYDAEAQNITCKIRYRRSLTKSNVEISSKTAVEHFVLYHQDALNCVTRF